MTQLKLTESLRKSARCVWFEAPEKAIADPARFAAYVLTYGSIADVAALREQMSLADIAEALDHAPPGIFDARSWAYWNLMVGREETPPMPVRRFE